jgi:UDP-3-O-[3-hydroxymyristoyl] glucosamine N-acyltransferase
VVIGDHFFAHAHSIVREYCRVGDHVTLQNGAIIGCDGFGFAKDDAGTWHKIVQSGPAILEDSVEVQANSCIDRASVGETRIGAGVKIDNLAQIGHGSKIGPNSLVCAQVGLAGSSETGKNVILAGQAGIAGHCKLGDGVIMTAQSGVSHDVPAGKMISGSPAFDNRQWLRSTAIFSRLPEIVKQMQRKERS